MPSTFGTLTPAIVALSPVVGSTVLSPPELVCATTSVVPSAVAWMPLLLKPGSTTAAGPCSGRVRDCAEDPVALTGTK